MTQPTTANTRQELESERAQCCDIINNEYEFANPDDLIIELALERIAEINHELKTLN